MNTSRAAIFVALALALGARRAEAQTPDVPATPAPTTKGAAPPTAATPAPPTPAAPAAPPTTEKAPEAAAAPAPLAVVGPMPVVVIKKVQPEQRVLFIADPVIDGAVLSLGAGWYILSSLIIGTGEIQPQQVAPHFKTSQLLPIDRLAVTQTLDKNAAMFSNIGLGVAVGYALVDPVLSGVREKTVRAAVVDAMIYAEAIAITGGATNLSKLAVRRPRPIEYIEFNACVKKNGPNANCNTTSTNSALSFVSGHASTTGAVWGTATYLAFARSPHSWRPWVTLFAGAALTTFVSVERVRSGDHFPTDVIAGSFAGAGVGVLTAHLHRDTTSGLKPMWIGWRDAPVGDGGAVTLNGLF